jgi:pimeloyl-ACP methyl ester carboxylesterase
LQTREEIAGELRKVDFSFIIEAERVPGILVLPVEIEGRLPLVLIQHPGTASKEDYFVREPARAWARRGWACAGIDAPFHGDRDPYDPMSVFREPGRFDQVVEQFSREVSTTIDLLAEQYPIELGRVGYVGYSMGSMLGIPAVARDGRFKAAAFCLVGEGGIGGNTVSYADRLGTVAVRIVGKLQDDLIPRASTEALYNALPGEKDIIWLPGGHFEIGPDVVKAAGDWLAANL